MTVTPDKHVTAGGAISNNASLGGTAWVNPDRARTLAVTDGGDATCSFTALNETSQFLVWQDFNNSTGDVSAPLSAAIPLGATITGISVTIYGTNDAFGTLGTGTVGQVVLTDCRLLVAGAIAGTNRAADDDMSLNHSISLGGPGDMFDLTPTRAQVIASNFGFVIRAKQTVANTLQAKVDSAYISITHTGAAPGTSTHRHRLWRYGLRAR